MNTKLKSFQYTFTPGQTYTYPGGGYFTLADVTDEVSIECFVGHTSLGLIENIGAGFWADLDKFDYIKITSATAQTINILIGDGSMGVNKTSSNISGGTIDLISEVTPQKNGVSHYLRLSVNGTLQTIVTPASNTNGVKITSLHIYSTDEWARVMMKQTAPTSSNDGTPIARNYTQSATGGAKQTSFLTLPLIIPAGYGLYEQSSAAANTSIVDMAYEIL